MATYIIHRGLGVFLPADECEIVTSPIPATSRQTGAAYIQIMGAEPTQEAAATLIREVAYKNEIFCVSITKMDVEENTGAVFTPEEWTEFYDDHADLIEEGMNQRADESVTSHMQDGEE